jgi:hypothetical protein
MNFSPRVLTLVFTLLLTPLFSSAQNTITLDPDTHFQTITGWESNTFILFRTAPGFSSLRDTLLDIAVHDIGMNRIQLNVKSGVENTTDYYAIWVENGCPDWPDPLYYDWRYNRYATVNDNEDPNVINWDGFNFTEMDWEIENKVLPMKQRMEENGEDLHISLSYVGFAQQIQGGGEYIHHDPPAEYGEFILAATLHMQNRWGLTPDSWEAIIEPDNVLQWDGTLIGQAIVEAGIRLAAHGIDAKFSAPSNTDMGEAVVYFDDLIQVEGVLPYLEEISYHRYVNANPQNLQQIANRAVQYGLNTSMLEWWFDNATYEVLYEDLTLGRNSAWQGHALDGLVTFDISDTTNIQIEVRDVVKYNRQYFKYVRKGAVRIGASSNNGLLAPTAFVNSNGNYVVVVKAVLGSDFTVYGLPAGLYGIKYTTGSAGQPPTAYDVDLADVDVGVDGALSTGIPSGGLITIYRKTTNYVENDPASQPLEWSFTEVYPNPFNPSTNISFSLKEQAVVNATIYNLAGQRVTVLADNSMTAGNHILTFDGSALANGMYFLNLEAGPLVVRRKLILMK